MPTAQWCIQVRPRGDDIIVERYHRFPRLRMFSENDFRKLTIAKLFNRLAENRYKRIDFDFADNIKQVEYQFNFSVFFPDANLSALTSTIVLTGLRNKSRVAGIIRSVVNEEERILRFGFTKSEMEIAKGQLLRSTDFSSKVSSNELCGSFERHFFGLSAEPGFKYVRDNIDRWVNSISEKDVREALAEWRKQSSPDIVITTNENLKGVLPNECEFRKILTSIQNMKNLSGRYEAVVSKDVMSPKEVKELSDEMMYGRSVVQEIGASILSFGNGLQVVIKPIKATGLHAEEIILKGARAGGASLYHDSHYKDALICASLVFASGVGNIQKDELDRRLSALNTAVSPFVTDSHVGFNGETTNEEFETLIQLVYLYLTKPRIDKKAAERYLRGLALGGQCDGESLYDSILVCYNTSENYLCGKKIRQEEIDFDDALNIYNELFQNFNGFRFVVTGDFDSTYIESILTKYFGSIPDKPSQPFLPSSNILDESCKSPETEVIRILRDAPSGGSVVDIQFFSRSNLSIESELKRSVFRNVLQDALFNRLRGSMGDAYFVIVDDENVDSTTYKLTVSFKTNYGNVHQMLDAIWAEIELLANTELDDLTVEAAIVRQIAQININTTFHDFWQRYFFVCFETGRDLLEISKWMEAIKAVRPRDIQECAKKHLKSNKVTDVYMKGV